MNKLMLSIQASVGPHSHCFGPLVGRNILGETAARNSIRLEVRILDRRGIRHWTVEVGTDQDFALDGWGASSLEEVERTSRTNCLDLVAGRKMCVEAAEGTGVASLGFGTGHILHLAPEMNTKGCAAHIEGSERWIRRID